MPFKDRTDAGCQLARALAAYRDQRPVVLALPRGGVTVAAEVASALAAPLIVRNKNVIALVNVNESEFKAVCDGKLAELERRRTRYLGNRKRVDVAGSTAIIVDEGIATGATVRAALGATRLRKPDLYCEEIGSERIR